MNREKQTPRQARFNGMRECLFEPSILCEGVTFAGIDALEPRVLKIWADLNRTVVEPSTAAEAATEFASIADAAPGTLAG